MLNLDAYERRLLFNVAHFIFAIFSSLFNVNMLLKFKRKAIPMNKMAQIANRQVLVVQIYSISFIFSSGIQAKLGIIESIEACTKEFGLLVLNFIIRY